MGTEPQPVHYECCDHCMELLRRDVNGYWVGGDGTSDCPDSARGHEVDGVTR